MQIELESSLDRWIQATLVNPEQAVRIREFEAAHAPRQGARAPILIGIALGGIMLAAGVLLFVAAHWMDLSPTQRMALLVLAVAGSHIAAVFYADRFPAMAITLHAVGTAALGGAIFLAGQIFNMQEHWPTGVLLWAIGALARCWLLRDWTEAASLRIDDSPIVAAFCALLAICYLSVPDQTLRWIGGVALLPAALVLVMSDAGSNVHTPFPGAIGVIGWAGAFLLPLGFAAIYRKSRIWMNAIAAIWVGVLSSHLLHDTSIGIFAWCAVGCAGMIAWGVQKFRAERINLGMAGFAITILVFYFSNVMDKLGRSASLMLLGGAFLAGAWYWEKLRRKLVARVNAGGLA